MENNKADAGFTRPGEGDPKGEKKRAPPKGWVSRKIEFIGIVTEVHSGDTITIKSKKNGRTGRFNLTNVRAPQFLRGGKPKPFALEARETTRRLTIGREVNVNFEYEKTFTVKQDDQDVERNIKSCIITVDGKNVALELVQAGYAEVQIPYTEEETSACFEELEAAQADALAKKRGLHSDKEYKPPHYNDLSVVKTTQTLKWAFEDLKDKRHVGVVDHVLNGGKFKVRLLDVKQIVLVHLEGVKVLPNDENVPGYEQWSNNALQFARDQLMQRDVEVILTSTDRRGNMFGTVLYKKQDFAEVLISEGLALSIGTAKQQGEYDKAEERARDTKRGLWGANLRLDFVKGGRFGTQNLQQVNASIDAAQVTEIVDTNEFYVQDQNSKELQEVDRLLQDFDAEKWLNLQEPIKKDTPCVALFEQDNSYYRAKIVKPANQKGMYTVQYTDFGNYADVPAADIHRMSERLLAIKPQALKCAFAFAYGPNKKNALYGDSTYALADLVWEKSLVARVLFRDNEKSYVILFQKGDDVRALEKSVNARLLRQGIIRLEDSADLPQEYDQFYAEQEVAQQQGLGVWVVTQEE